MRRRFWVNAVRSRDPIFNSAPQLRWTDAILIPELLQQKHLAPKKKFRNPERYFRKAIAQAERFAIKPQPDDWWAYWHTHADWDGRGNANWKYRREFLRALAIVFEKIASAKNEFSTPFQTWLHVSGRNAGDDAVYLHSVNPNEAPFPFIPENVDWNDHRLRGGLQSLLLGFELRIGHTRSWDEFANPPAMQSTFYIYAKGVGVPLEQLSAAPNLRGS